MTVVQYTLTQTVRRTTQLTTNLMYLPDIINHFPYNVVFLLYFIVFYIIHCKITYAASFTKILS